MAKTAIRQSKSTFRIFITYSIFRYVNIRRSREQSKFICYAEAPQYMRRSRIYAEAESRANLFAMPRPPSPALPRIPVRKVPAKVPFARHLLVLVLSSRLHLPHSKAFLLTSSLFSKESCFPVIRPLLPKESAQSFFSLDSLRFLIRNVSSFTAFSSHLPKVCSFPRFSSPSEGGISANVLHGLCEAVFP